MSWPPLCSNKNGARGPSWMPEHYKFSFNHDLELQKKNSEQQYKDSPWHDNNFEIVLNCVGVGYGAYLHFGMHKHKK